MSGTRQKTQHELDQGPMDKGEAPVDGCHEAEPRMAKPAPESPAATTATDHLMEVKD